jgi:hypothetical protein
VRILRSYLSTIAIGLKAAVVKQKVADEVFQKIAVSQSRAQMGLRQDGNPFPKCFRFSFILKPIMF